MRAQNTGVGNLLVVAQATDADSGNAMLFEFYINSLTFGGNTLDALTFFSINASSGEIRTVMSFYSNVGNYLLEVNTARIFI